MAEGDMTGRLIAALLFGLLGAAVLVGLGVWQLQRLAWKEEILARIESQITAEPVALPKTFNPDRDSFLPVRVTGTWTGEELRVLASRKQIGPGFRLIAGFRTDEGRRVMIDRGFLPEAAVAGPPEGAEVIGNLLWPDEVDGFTPPPDAATGLFFARDLHAMAGRLGTEPVLIVARAPTGGGVEPLPVDTSGIPNDHLGYAVQWFGLALVWLGMTVYLLWRIRRRTI
jgi:surfeit locus 1 family protein